MSKAFFFFGSRLQLVDKDVHCEELTNQCLKVNTNRRRLGPESRIKLKIWLCTHNFHKFNPGTHPGSSFHYL